MKKIVMVLCALAITLGVKAQYMDSQSTTSGKFGVRDEMLGGAGLHYQFLDGGFRGLLSIQGKYFELFGSMYSGDTDKYIKKNEGWSAGIGAHYRYWFHTSIFVEGNLGVAYNHMTLKFDDQEESNGKFGLYFHPRVGLKLFTFKDSEMALVGGYRWDFNEFKFGKENTTDGFTVGLSWLM